MRLAFSPDGYTLAIGCRDGEIYIFTSSDDDDWSEAAMLHDHSSNVRHCTYCPCQYLNVDSDLRTLL